MQCHEVDYQIHGNDLQLVEVELDPGETVIAEAGAMIYMDEDIAFNAKLGDGSEPDQGVLKSFFGAVKRKMTGESMFLTHFTHEGSQGKRRVAFASSYPGKIVALDLSRLGGVMYCQKNAFLAAALGTKISIAFTKRFGAGVFGGEGFVLQKLEGDGKVFVHAGGAVIKKKLDGSTLRVDTGCLVAFTEGVDYSIERAGGLKSMLFGGEGMFLATLSGVGSVLLQSLPFSRLAEHVNSHSSQQLGSSD